LVRGALELLDGVAKAYKLGWESNAFKVGFPLGVLLRNRLVERGVNLC
jgi:hypothetical protein